MLDEKITNHKCQYVNCGLDHLVSYRCCAAHKSAMATRAKSQTGRVAQKSGSGAAGPSVPSLDNTNFPL